MVFASFTGYSGYQNYYGHSFFLKECIYMASVALEGGGIVPTSGWLGWGGGGHVPLVLPCFRHLCNLKSETNRNKFSPKINTLS